MWWISAGAGLLMLSGQAPAEMATADFCARLAADSGIATPAAPDRRTAWTVNALSFGQRFLVCGSAATGVGVAPVEPATVEDFRRLKDMCLPQGKGAVCNLVGPVEFKFVWKGRNIVTRMAADERAKILVQGTKASCQSESPV